MKVNNAKLTGSVGLSAVDDIELIVTVKLITFGFRLIIKLFPIIPIQTIQYLLLTL